MKYCDCFNSIYLVIKIPVMRNTVEMSKPENDNVINVILEQFRLLIKLLNTFDVPRMTTIVKNNMIIEKIGQSTLKIKKKKQG